MKPYTVRNLARMAGVSVRTLHHYDHLGLLKPSSRTDAGYRLYGQKDLLTLQQILFFKELDFPLGEIKDILSGPGFDRVKALREHGKLLKSRAKRLKRLIKVVGKTIRKLTEKNMPMTDAELYEGFTKEQITRYKREVREKFDPTLVAESERRVRKMTKGELAAIRKEQDDIPALLALIMDREPSDPGVQKLITRHHALIEKFYHASAEVYRGLGKMYTEHADFRKFYDKHRPGLADFMIQMETRRY